MIIFTVTNKTTAQVYVGSTRNDLIDQWEKMVAAAEQNLDFPLYQEIRTHGRDGFVVEEWDYVEHRSELNALEQEAIEILNARSLKGYKTSTVKIRPKKKARARKASVDASVNKELVNIFNDLDDVLDDFDDITPETKQQVDEKAPAPTSKPEVTHAAPEASTPSSDTSCGESRPAAKSAEATGSEEISNNGNQKLPEKPENGSLVNAVVQMNDICLGDNISAQLEAIQAAATAVLSGDSSAIEMLNKPDTPAPTPAVQEPEVVIQLNPRERRIREAIERHRKARAQKTSDYQSSEREKIEKLLTELNTRALNINNQNVSAAV